MHYFFKNFGLYFQAQIRKTMYKVMMTKEGSTKIFLISQPPWREVSVVSDTRVTLKACGSLVRKMLSWYKAGKLYEDNEYQYVIMLKGW